MDKSVNLYCQIGGNQAKPVLHANAKFAWITDLGNILIACWIRLTQFLWTTSVRAHSASWHTFGYSLMKLRHHYFVPEYIGPLDSNSGFASACYLFMSIIIIDIHYFIIIIFLILIRSKQHENHTLFISNNHLRWKQTKTGIRARRCKCYLTHNHKNRSIQNIWHLRTMHTNDQWRMTNV